LRVIAGSARGRRLKTPRGRLIRPTLERVKESLFNILNPGVTGCVFLDLFAGSGNVGIEALSRGCARAFFVDNDRRAILCIKENLETLGLAERAEIYKMDVLKSLDLFKKREIIFDIIFIDPPYFKQYEAKTLSKINENGLLGKGGTIVVESSKKIFLPLRIGDLFNTRRAEYGDTALSFYRRT